MNLYMFYAMIFIALFGLTSTAPAQGTDQWHTLFGKDKRATNRAMKSISDALGVRCTYCHVRVGKKMDYRAETPQKIVTRDMKRALVDRLASRGDTVVTYSSQKHPIQVRAIYEMGEEHAEIRLFKSEDGGPEVHAQIRVLAGTEVSCATCHAGAVHIFKSEQSP